VLNIFHLILKALKPDKTQLYLTFASLIDSLKEQGIHLSVAARAIGQNVKTVGNWVNRRSGPRQEHIDALLEAFPVQLLNKAVELELDPSASMANSDEVIKELTEVIERQEKELALYSAAKEEIERINELKKENALLKAKLIEVKKG
jgi:hypothetical protein